MSEFKEKTFWVEIQLRALGYQEYEGDLDIYKAKKELEDKINSDIKKLGYLDPYFVDVQVK